MRILNGRTFYSPSDLTLFHDSPFASWCEQSYRATEKTFPTPDAEDEFQKILQQRGYAHEEWLVQHLSEQGRTVVNVGEACGENASFLEQVAHTTALMQQGADVIFQAALMDDRFAGYADFVVRIDKPSALGDYSYEVWDTKLSKHPKVSYLLQLTAYAKMIQIIQGVLPGTVTVVLGNQEFVSYQTVEYLAYFDSTKHEFLAAKESFSTDCVPDPFESTSFGRWTNYAEQLLREVRHLSLVANIKRSQIHKLTEAGVHTIDDIANVTDYACSRVPAATLQKLVEQAQLQIATEQAGSPQYRYRRVLPGNPPLFDGLQGFSLGDIYFDLEGNPLVEGGLEFLWGMTLFNDAGDQEFKAIWAHDHEQEKQALARFFEITLARRKKYPNMRIYHYAHYELTVLRRLTGRYGIYEYEFDQLLREHVFVDLYRVVKNSLILGLESYSIKKVESFYLKEKRTTEVGLGGDAIVAYQRWSEAGGVDDEILANIEAYNKDDCDSTYELAQWLRGLKAGHVSGNGNDMTAAAYSNSKQEDEDQHRVLKEKLLTLAQQKTEPNAREAIETLMYLVDFYKREKRPFWWQYFEWMQTPDEELIDEKNVIVGCSVAYAYDDEITINYLQEQEALISIDGDYCIKEGAELPLDWPIKVQITEENGEQLEVKLMGQFVGAQLPETFSLVAHSNISTRILQDRILEFAEQVVSDQQLPKSVLSEILQRNLPRFVGERTTITANECNQDERITEVIKLVEELDRSYLTIQGPPGTGKTYTASRIIGHLLRNKPNVRIGISSNSHKAINNLLKATASYCCSEGVQFSGFTKRFDSDLAELGVNVYTSRDLNNLLGASGAVIGGTAWAFARVAAQGALDYLFIDEAGQVSMANIAAMSGSTKNIVFMGDQMQLGQPIQGSHPGDAGLSALDYLMKGYQVVPVDKGVLLNRSFRMHDAVLQFISDNVYQGRLEADPNNNNQSVDGRTGIEFHEIHHVGNVLSSREEVEHIVALYRELLNSQYTDKEGLEHAMTSNDILIVTPYNLQVNRLKRAIPNARIGTVDKFQGQEAPVVIFSFCSSAPDESPRGLDFLFDICRLNVAISRAKSLAIVVGSPKLMSVKATSVSLMKKASMVRAIGKACSD